MKLVYKNPLPAIEARLVYYKCHDCQKEFRWTKECLSRTFPDPEEIYHDKTECLCEECSELYLNKQLKLNL